MAAREKKGEPRLEELKETVEREEGAPKAAPEARERGEVDRIVERLKKKEAPAPKPELAEVADRLLEARPEEIKAAPKLDFRRVAVDAAFREQMKSLGKLYFLFEKPVSLFASILSRLPVARNIWTDLEAANIPLGVEAYFVSAALLSLATGALVAAGVALLGVALNDYGIATAALPLGILAVVISAVGGAIYPSIRAGERAIAIDRELPFALRQLATEVKAGLSFNRAIASVAQADYGELGVEMRRAIKDTESGATTEEAFSRVLHRAKSRGLKRALIQIIRSLRTGGRLSEVISSIADDVAFETRMSIRDFTEVLNLISVVYIMVAVVAPVTLTVLSAVIQLPLIAANVPQALIVLAFMGIILGIGALIFVTIRLEPAM